MITQEITDGWLENLNKRYRDEDIAPASRPWLAVREWSIINNSTISLQSEGAGKIFEWFEKNTKPDSQTVGSLLTGAFYFDSSFWPVFIPICYGIGQLDPLDSLQAMPEKLKAQLKSGKDSREGFISFWVNCFDYAYGYDDIFHSDNGSAFSKELLRSANKELTASVTLLLDHKPNPKSAESAAMATEMFLKAFLAFTTTFTEKDAKDFSHKIERLLDECIKANNHVDIKAIRPLLPSLPTIHERYIGKDRSLREMWDAYITAQVTGTTVVRLLSGRDMRPDLNYGGNA